MAKERLGLSIPRFMLTIAGLFAILGAWRAGVGMDEFNRKFEEQEPDHKELPPHLKERLRHSSRPL